jgi:hypothetical protein
MLPRRQVAGSSSRPDFGGFLCSQLWVESSGMSLSVVSALARLNLDPPREALRLATLPRPAAALSFAKTLARLPDAPAATEIADTAVRLTKLLPDMAVVAAVHEDKDVWRPPPPWWIRACRTWQLWLILLLAGAVIYLALTGTRKVADGGRGNAQSVIAASLSPPAAGRG